MRSMMDGNDWNRAEFPEKQLRLWFPIEKIAVKGVDK
jgi:hypothetical protein